ncbi:toxin C-terminal domain-containing protein, partial [Actimicrobium sp. CCI2.3]
GGVWAHNAKCSINPLRKANAEDAAKLGYNRLIKDPPFDPHGQKVFGNGKNYISPDADGHNGGVWKMFDRKGGRIGTYDGDLTLIKD